MMPGKIRLVAAQGFSLVAAALFPFDAFGPKLAPLPVSFCAAARVC